MSGLREPGCGPIVGHTTDTTCRLWIRAADPADERAILDEDRRTVGVIAILKKNGKRVEGQPAYFRLHREFDRTGCFNLGGDFTIGEWPTDGSAAVPKPGPLDPDTDYVVGLGTLTVDDPLPNEVNVSDTELAKRLPKLGPWIREELDKFPADAKAQFRTFPSPAKDPADRLAFIVGSCRYPGLLWKVKQADRIFGPIADQLDESNLGPRVQLVLMVGDQIYADTLNRLIPMGRADTYGEFQERYLTAYRSPNMRRLLRSVPHYMILDDHEIEDNWTQDRLRCPDKRQLFNIAISAYMSYQWSHGPRTFGRLLYYHFSCSGYPFFVLDTRTQRYKEARPADLSDNYLLGRPSLHDDEPSQTDRLLNWLTTQQQERGNAPKMIVSSSVFVPNDITERTGDGDDADGKRLERSDSWPAYPNTRRAILDCIVANQVQNVVFLSGDIHCSNVAEMTFTRNGNPLDLRAFSITSSAFYWPFPFADGDPANYVHDSKQQGQEDSFRLSDGTIMDYRAWNFTQDDNYCRVTLDRARHALDLVVFDIEGRKVRIATANGGSRNLEESLSLAPW
jgi:alkaline phosphatase D